MHTQISHAHRDLKPGNGNLRISTGLIIAVLYSRPDNRWKLTDFGISAEATSRKAHTTLYSKGTSSYRTPELLGEHAAFTNKVDIWALGCILHELATGKYAFHEDWAVREYFLKGEDLFIPLSASNGFFKNLIYGAVNDLLSRDWNQRPAASSVCLMFLACSRLLDLPIMYALNASRSYPSYAEWKGLVENHPNELDFLSELATLYERIGEASLAVALQQAADSRTNWGQERTWSEGPGDSIVKAELISEKAGDGGALKLLETAVQLDADNFWSWHNLCDAYVGMGDCDAAIRVCNQEITRFPSNPWPVLALANAYAVKGEYHEAISVHMKFFVGRLSGGGHRRSETAIFDRLVSQQPHGMIVVPIEMVET
jgi:serine/threonine protein kinase